MTQEEKEECRGAGGGGGGRQDGNIRHISAICKFNIFSKRFIYIYKRKNVYMYSIYILFICFLLHFATDNVIIILIMANFYVRNI